jgi:GT2 family glycosyltransferase
MKNEPFVSVVVATYNRKDLLAGCIDALINQSYPKDKYEVIIVDDGSTDGTKELLEKYSIDQSKLKTFWQKNRGVAAARNLGIKNAKGEIVCFTDDDCVTDKDRIRNLVDAYNDDKIGGVGGRILGYNPNSLLEKYAENVGNFNQEKLIENENFIVAANSSYRKDILDSIKGFDDEFQFSDDMDISIRVKLKGFSLKYAPEAIVYHRHRTTLKGLFKQWYGYGRGYSLRHKKYTKDFNALPLLAFYLRRILFKIFTLPLKLLKATFGTDKKYHFAEAFLDIIVLNSYLLGSLIEIYFGIQYKGEKYDKKLEF